VIEELKLGGVDDGLSRFAMVRAQDPERIGSFVSLTVRAEDPAAILPEMRRVVREADPQLPIVKLGTGRSLMADAAAQPRFLLSLLATLAGLAVALAAIGTYAVLAHAVRQRRRETGIRIALGASAGRVHRHVLGGGVALAAVGVVLGLVLASVFTRYTEGLLYGVAPSDIWTRVGAAALMLGVATLACWVPATRATRVDPVGVLKAD